MKVLYDVTDVTTGEVHKDIEFYGVRDLTGINKSLISQYAKNGYTYNKRWKIKRTTPDQEKQDVYSWSQDMIADWENTVRPFRRYYERARG